MTDGHALSMDAPARAGLLAALDPRARVLAAAAFVVTVSTLSAPAALGAALGMAVLLAVTAALPLGITVRRLAAMEAFLLVLLALLPFTFPGRPVFEVMGLPVSHEGLVRAAVIAVKVNASVLAIAALLSTLDVVALGHALGRLRVPLKLVHLLLLTVRYVAVFADELERLRCAMRARAFRARTDWHTWQTLGWLLGMLLVRSFERAERVLAAMKCRGFVGRFPLLDDFRSGPPDAVFGCLVAAAIAALATMELLA